jgi:hypothetical protein
MSGISTSIAVSSVVATAAAGFLIISASEKGQRRRRRHYLTRLSLPPVYCSAWRSVLTSQDGRGLLNTTGFDRATFRHLLALFHPLWQGERSRERDVRSCDVLGLVLQFLNSTARCKTLCQVFAFPPASLSRYLRKGLALLLKVTKQSLRCITLLPHTFTDCVVPVSVCRLLRRTRTAE